MSTSKEYTQQNKPNNPLVKAAAKKGLTNFKITWRKAMATGAGGRGWILESDQTGWRRIGYDQTSALNTINDLQL